MDFVEATVDRRAGDFVYCGSAVRASQRDVKLHVVHGRRLYDRPTRSGCATWRWHLKRRDVHVMLSNADLPIVRELYKEFTIHEVQARRNVNSDASKRGKVGEVIIV